jgi:hypothetical protein
MHSSASALTQLSRGECLRLMGSVAVGRIVYTRQALPAVELVNFALDHGEIVVKTDGGSKLAAATRNAVVAFEADYVEPGKHVCWSVTVVGVFPGGDRRRGNRPVATDWAQLVGSRHAGALHQDLADNS